MKWLIPLVLLLGCHPVFQPREAIRYEAHPAYERWYAAMAKCVGVCRSRWGEQEFWVVEGNSFPCPAYDGACAGWWTPAHSITVASYSVDDSLIVSHELLHDILQRPHGPVTDLVFARCGV